MYKKYIDDLHGIWTEGYNNFYIDNSVYNILASGTIDDAGKLYNLLMVLILSATNFYIVSGNTVTKLSGWVFGDSIKFVNGTVTTDNVITISYQDDVTTIVVSTESGGSGSYELPIASETTLGGIKVGENLTIDEDGTLNAESGDGGAEHTEFTAVDGVPYLYFNGFDTYAIDMSACVMGSYAELGDDNYIFFTTVKEKLELGYRFVVYDTKSFRSGDYSYYLEKMMPIPLHKYSALGDMMDSYFIITNGTNTSVSVVQISLIHSSTTSRLRFAETGRLDFGS